MLEEYLIMLYIQYCNAKKIEIDDIEKYKTDEEFINWIVQNKSISKEYKEYLLYLNIPIYDESIEVGKGKYDTIADNNIQIVSQYGRTLNRLNLSLIEAGGTPIIISLKRKLILPHGTLLITHNPYKKEEIISWCKFHNSGLYNISIGMYGSIYDANEKEKLQFIMHLKTYLSEDIEINYDTLNNNYFCTLNSKRTAKRKILKK